MARKAKSAGPVPVEAITHADKRANLPTADSHDFVAPELDQPIPVRYARDPTLDPQLVWKGKDRLDADDLVADAPPIYIQEKVDPRVLIENLRTTAERPEDEPELTLFESFDGLPELDRIEFYEHGANWSNRMILGDSLNVMASLRERERLRGKVQMIYVDPPYGIRFGSNWQVSARKREVKDGKLEDATREVEQIRAFRDTWELGIHSYLTYLRDRLAAAKDLLTDSGSIFVQIGDENVHLVRAMMDEVFGSENCCAQIAFQKTGGFSPSLLSSVYDYLLRYARDRTTVKFRKLFRDRPISMLAGGYPWVEEDGSRRRLRSDELYSPTTQGSRFQTSILVSAGVTAAGSKPFAFNGVDYRPAAGTHWKTTAEGLERLALADRLMAVGKTLTYVRFADDFPYTEFVNVWDDTVRSTFASDKWYVVQTNEKVVQRCMLMVTDPGDLVVDPTCGGGTTAYVAEQWGRRWITIDTSRVALALARQRLMSGRYPYYLLVDSPAGRAREGELAGSQLPAAETTGDIRHGFVYQRASHITLKSIANNPDLQERMARQDLEATIRRHADYEFLYDRPYEDDKKVRVSGPFTVESLSPHRSLAFASSAVHGAAGTSELSDEGSTEDATFEQMILDNLREAGIQNGRKGERLQFSSIESYAAAYIQAIGERDDVGKEAAARRIGITIGPQYGTVGPAFIKDAAREANRADDLDLLCVLGFAFDPAALGTGDGDYIASEVGFANVAAERRLGKVPVLLVRMNADLVMGEELKKTDAGNLFTVFGEPDIRLEKEGENVRVGIRGVDVYDPNTGEVRSSETDQIALWMIDTAYNGESFFVRHCYFTGGQDPYKRLKTALKADIDEDAWSTLYRTESRPFPRPETGKIAVKVINDYGDEVMKVFEV
jgi:adenine-specific DNA-methyltransferase